VEAKAALALLANDDASDLVSPAFNRVSFGHGCLVRRQCRRPLAVHCLGSGSGALRQHAAVNNTAGLPAAGSSEHGPHGGAARRQNVSLGAPFEGVHEDTSWHLSV
jgi:hypothetical protein